MEGVKFFRKGLRKNLASFLLHGFFLKKAVMKAQFFILGAVLILSVLLAGMPFIFTTTSENTFLFTENVINEYPTALNLGLGKDKSAEYLADFSLFAKSNSPVKAIWVVSELSGSGIKVTAGNFFDTEKTIKITVNNEEKTAAVGKDSTSIILYDTVPDAFSVAIEWGGGEKTLSWTKTNANLFVSAEFEFGKNKVIKEYY